MRTAFTISFMMLVTFSFSQKILIKDYDSQEVMSRVYAYSDCQTSLSDSKGIIDVSTFCKDADITLQHAGYVDYIIHPKDLQPGTEYTVYMISSIFNLDEVVVSSSKWDEGAKKESRVVKKIDIKKTNLYNPQTAADVLSANAKVFVQKSQLGGGSPMIRGFSANRVLLVMDGVRMNNAIYRSGNLQNILNVDAFATESAEVIFGPGSVMYGSDALGGVMSFSTHKPQFSEDKFQVQAKGMMRFSSANQEKTAGVAVRISSPKWSSVTSVSSSMFGDLRMGSKGHPEYERSYYVINHNQKDSVLKNQDPNLQLESGYDVYNISQKLAFKIDSNWTLAYHFYYSKLSDVPRYDRLIQLKNGQPKYAQWYYGPQKWMMNSLSLESNKKTRLYNRFKALVAYQNYQESRHKRKLNNAWRSNQFEKINMFSVNLDFYKKLSPRNKLYYGLETWYNKLSSSADRYHIYNENSRNSVTRYPDGASYISSAVYLTDKYQITEKWFINSGLRYSFTDVRAEFDTAFYKFPYRDMKVNNSALSGSLGLVFSPNKSSKLSFNYASGFRSPNIDDLSKVFDSGMGTLVVPNPNLQPEYAHSIDLTFEQELWKRFRILCNVYHTYLDKAMVLSDFQFKGQDSIMYDGYMAKVKAVTNKDYARIYGFQVALDWKVYQNFFVKSSVNYSKGEDSEGFALRHVPPIFGGVNLLYDNSRLKVDFNLRYNGERSYQDLAQCEREKSHIYAQDRNGNPYSPAWYTLNLNASYDITSFLNIAVGLENILDQRYRPYSSGIAAPGRNFIMSLRLHSF